MCSSKKGFTLIELLAVISILAILIIIALPNIIKMFNEARKGTFETEVKTIYKQAKTGKIAIYRNYNKTTLTLITCTNYDSKTQTVYISELVSTETE